MTKLSKLKNIAEQLLAALKLKNRRYIQRRLKQLIALNGELDDDHSELSEAIGAEISKIQENLDNHNECMGYGGVIVKMIQDKEVREVKNKFVFNEIIGMRKKLFSLKRQKEILEKSKKIIIKKSLPNDSIEKILITGSLIIFEFGEYDEVVEKFGRRYSDVDCVFIVNDQFKPNNGWEVIAEREYWNVYEIGKLERKFPIQALVVNKRLLKDKRAIAEGEKKKVPMRLEKGKVKFLEIYDKN